MSSHGECKGSSHWFPSASSAHFSYVSRISGVLSGCSHWSDEWDSHSATLHHRSPSPRQASFRQQETHPKTLTSARIHGIAEGEAKSGTCNAWMR